MSGAPAPPLTRPRRGIAARVLLALLTVAAFAILAGLGTWQLQRLQWKEALIAQATERPLMAPVAPPGPDAWSDFDIDGWNYRAVELTGRYRPGEVYAWTVLSDANGPLEGPGFYVVAPFETGDGWTVLVNRGFVPQDARDPAARPGSEPPEGEVAIQAIVRRDDRPNVMSPSPDLAARTFYTRHIEAMAPALGLTLARVAPYSLDLEASQTPPGGLPQAGESKLTFSNNHLQYALTWYGLAAALAGVVAASLWRARRR